MSDVQSAALSLVVLYRYDDSDEARAFNKGVAACINLLYPESASEPSVFALNEVIAVHRDFDGNPMPTEWPDALSEIRGLRKDNERLSAQNQTLHEDLSRQYAFRGWTDQERFTCWLNEGPKLADAAGLYVGIKVSEGN